MTPTAIAEVPDVEKAKQAAKLAKLHYVTDAKPGIKRVLGDDGFEYFAPDVSACHRRGRTHAHKEAGDSSSLYGRLDLPGP